MRKILFISCLIIIILTGCSKQVNKTSLGHIENKTKNTIEETKETKQQLSNAKNYSSSKEIKVNLDDYTSDNTDKLLLNNNTKTTVSIDGEIKTVTYQECLNILNEIFKKKLKNYKIQEDITYNYVHTTEKQIQGIYLNDNTEIIRQKEQYYKDNKRTSSSNFKRTIDAVKYKNKENGEIYVGSFNTLEKDKEVKLDWKIKSIENEEIKYLTALKSIDLSGLYGFYEFDSINNFKAAGKMTLKQWKNNVIQVNNSGLATLKNIEATVKRDITKEGVTEEKTMKVLPLDFDFEYILSCEDDIITFEADLTSTIKNYYKLLKEYDIDKALYKLTINEYPLSNQELEELFFTEDLEIEETTIKETLNLEETTEQLEETIKQETETTKKNDNKKESNIVKETEPETKKEIKEEVKETQPAKSQIKTGKYTENGQTVFYDNKGNKITSKLYTYENKDYYLDKNGNALSGWQQINNLYYYFNESTKEKHYGWLQIGEKIYYLDPKDKGALTVNKTIFVDNKYWEMGSDGAVIKERPDLLVSNTTNTTNNTITTTENNVSATGVQGVLSRVHFIENMNKKKDITEYDPAYITEIEFILNNIPSTIIDKLNAQQIQIYVCVNQTGSTREFLQTGTYKDSETKETETEQIPFKYSNAIYIQPEESIKILYYGIGNFIAKTYKYQGSEPYKNIIWATIQKNKKEELDDLMGLAGDIPFYRYNAETSLSCAIGQYLIDGMRVHEYSPKAFSFIHDILK